MKKILLLSSHIKVNGETIKVISSYVNLEMENGRKPAIKFNVWHNMQQHGNINTLEAAVWSWGLRTDDFTAESFCEYVMDKGTDMVAYTEEQFEKLEKK